VREKTARLPLPPVKIVAADFDESDIVAAARYWHGLS